MNQKFYFTMISNDKIKRIVHELFNKRAIFEGLDLGENSKLNIKAVYYFIHWLRKENLLKEYAANYDSSFAAIIHSIDSLLACGFLFRSTPQKSVFWNEKSCKWQSHVFNNIRTLNLLYDAKRH